MSVHFTKILRRAPADGLKSYLCREYPGHVSDLDWSASRKDLTCSLNNEICSLAEEEQERLFADMDRISQFMNDFGRNALRVVLEQEEEVIEAFDKQQDVTGCALFVLNRDGDAFERAVSAVYVDRRLNGRDWTGLDFESGSEPKLCADPQVSDFEDRLVGIFSQDGPTPRVVTDRFTRQETDLEGRQDVTREQFTIFVEKEPEAAISMNDQKELETLVVRPLLEAAVVFDSSDGTLDVVAKGGGKTRRRQIAEAFVETMLKPGAALASRPRRTLALDLLKKRPNFSIELKDGVQSVQVTKLTLGAPDHRSIITFEVPARLSDGADDLYQRAERAFRPKGVFSRNGWRVLGAKLKIVFNPEEAKRRTKSVTFELKLPDRTNLRDQLDLHRKIADDLLARWGLYQTVVPN